MLNIFWTRKMNNTQIVILGYGSVSQCLLPLLTQHVTLEKNITIIDKIDYKFKLQSYINLGLKFIQKEITPQNYKELLCHLLKENDLLIDLSVNIESLDLIKWCNNQEVKYINTSLEIWDTPTIKRSINDITLNKAHDNVRKFMQSKQYQNSSKQTVILEHGANPGLVSHLVKKALIDLSQHLETKQLLPTDSKEYLEKQNFPYLAYSLGIKVIHVSEKDSQIISRPKRPDEFINTWSVDGLYKEGMAPAEVGWGSHETKIPKLAKRNKYGNKNSLQLCQSGKNIWMKSWVPDENIIGMAITHGESLSINEYLSINHAKFNYCPTVHYVYKPTDYTLISLYELDTLGGKLHPKKTILNDEIIDGQDKLGVLLMGNPHCSWWTGSLLDIHQSRIISPNQSATTLQVAGAMIGAVIWILQHDNQGILYPDQLPWQSILNIAEQYWGGFYSVPSNWNPSQFQTGPFDRRALEHAWQFENFMVKK